MYILAMAVSAICGLFILFIYYLDYTTFGSHTFPLWTVILIEVICAIVFFIMWRERKLKKENKKALNTYVPNPFVDVTCYDRNEIPKVNYPNLVLKEGEKLIYAAPAAVFVEKEKVIGYTGGSTGVSIRVAKGLTLRQGASKGTPVRDRVKDFFGGDYVVTNQRLVFVAPQKPFDISLKKVSAVHNISEGEIFTAFSILTGNTAKNIWVERDQIKYAMACTMFAVDLANGNNEQYSILEEQAPAGESISDEQHKDKRYCTSCGMLLPINSKFCSNCGAKVEQK